MNSERISPFWVNGYQPFSAIPTYGYGDIVTDGEIYFLDITL